MTPSDWAASADPQAMLAFLRGRGASDRKLRLAGCACAGRVVRQLGDRRLGSLVALSERAVDGPGDAAALADHLAALQVDQLGSGQPALLNGRVGVVVVAAWGPGHSFFERGFGWLATAAAWTRCPGAFAVDDSDIPSDPAWRACWADEVAAQAALLRDIFGDPFNPTPFLPEWRTEAVVSLARGIYEDGGWSRLSVLADALEDAECDAVELMKHCREDGVHVKGCWAVDLVLRKE